jgi:hypothetical protein
MTLAANIAHVIGSLLLFVAAVGTVTDAGGPLLSMALFAASLNSFAALVHADASTATSTDEERRRG